MATTKNLLALILIILPLEILSKASGYVLKNRAWAEDLTRYVESPAGSGPTVTFCWESGASTIMRPNGRTYNFAEIRKQAKDIVTAQWERYAKIKFRWLETYGNSECNVKIYFSDKNYLGLVEGYGWKATEMYLNIDWMVPINEATWVASKYTPRNNWNSQTMQQKKNNQYGYFQETILHEVGHVMGFAHEHLRIEEGRKQYGDKDELYGDTEVGSYDVFSIMNYFRLHSPTYPNPMPKISCSDVASARFLYTKNPSYPNDAPNCTEEKVKAIANTNMTESQYTTWVGEANLNSTAKTIGATQDPPIYQVYSGPSAPEGYWENVTVHAELNPTAPGYILTFGLKNVNFTQVSCNQPVKFSDLTLYTVEDSWHHTTDYQPPQCGEEDDCVHLQVQEVSLSACHPTQVVNIPMGKGEYYPPKTFLYEDCRWKEESVAGWLIERISFGVTDNGTYECVQRNGSFSHVGIGYAPTKSPVALFELPANFGKMAAFYPKMIETSSKARARVILNSEGRQQAFWIDKYEVTQGSYYALMDELPAGNIGIASRPTENINWYEAILYCNKRSQAEGFDTVYSYSSKTYTPWKVCDNLINLSQDTKKNGYRLLSESEWTQAYHAGTSTRYFWGEALTPDVDKFCWYVSNSANMTHPVGMKLPNAWGLYDMAGNVEEWVWTTSPFDANSRRTMGSSYYNEAARMNGNLSSNPPTTMKIHIGFRVIRRAVDLTPVLNLLLQ